MRRRRLGLAACSMILAGTASAQGVDMPSGYGGFGGQYVQAPSLYYPYPGVIESRFGTYFTTPIIPPLGADSLVEAATIDAANAAHEGIDPVAKAKADADARAQADAEAAAPLRRAAARTNRRAPRTTLRNANNPPAPYRRALPRGNFEDLNNVPAGVPVYSPYARYQTYGQAYGMGPYGSNQYSGWWKAYAPMDVFNGPAEPLP